MSRIDPEPRRCSQCDIRLSRVGADHEDACFRKANGWPPFQDEGAPDPAPRKADCDYCGGWARHETWCRSITRLSGETRDGR